MPSDQPIEYLTQEQVADLLHVKTTTVKVWRQRRSGPPFLRVGRRLVRYRRDAVDAWMASGGGKLRVVK